MTIERELYSQEEFWRDYHQNVPGGKERIDESISLIPSDVQNILDVGCGEGTFVNSIYTKYQVIGLDASKVPLGYVRAETVCGNITSLPFKRDSFDLVTVFEVLEHLTQQDYKMALSEIQRVSKKYIGVSVPNQEPLEYYLVVCPACRCHFNLSRHVRSFDYDTLKDIFDQYTPLKIKEVGGGGISPYIQSNIIWSLAVMVRAFSIRNRNMPTVRLPCKKEKKVKLFGFT